ncbi:uncharacterized protein LOC122281327 isoform X2 [Carya illinoinensis]|uniref:uncharacterized protein LOC122281327 isoform X2 n=1 Tax=Carya illinoinensis TaxID=32201 RepID=UPI001C722FD8|nr:uncharacterized protein LOC122281327 isoform X2 [Carya illinoinensis]
MLNSHSRNNAIEFLQSGDTILSDPLNIKHHIVTFYEKLFREDFSWRPKLDGLDFRHIDQHSVDWLERPFEKEEVLYVVRGMVHDRALSLDGFSMAFFQDCWDIVQEDIMKVFLEFHVYMKVEKSLNATFIALILKKVGAVEMKDFRPISLVNWDKIISKVLTNHMSVVMEKIILKTQNAFIRGRQILDLVLVGSECLESRLREGVPDILAKLDMEKILYLNGRIFDLGERLPSWIFH